MKKYNKAALTFWTENKDVKHIIPPSSTTEFPEGWDVHSQLHNTIGKESVVELGCGYGRLAAAFAPDQYHGFDINPSAINQANERLPTHNFNLYEIGAELPNADWLLIYTVLLHVSDNDVKPMLTTITKNCNKIFLAEIMHRGPRRDPRPGKPPVFNREQEEYVQMGREIGFELTASIKKPWRGIQNRFSILTFER